MKYDFDKVVDRHGTNCLKYDFAIERGKPADILPLWVADMDFQTAPAILERLEETVKHGIFGYSDGKEGYFAAVQNWYRERFGWETKPEWLVKTPGVVFALAAAVRAYTKEGDGVLLQQPVYYPFSEVITDNGRKIVNSSLKITDGYYTMDFDDLETKIVENKVKLFLLCSPHNPVGRVWSEEELRRVGEICLRHGVLVVSDEIHSDFTREGHPHTVFAKLGAEFEQNCLICTAPSKTFNLAGLQISNIFVPNPELRKKLLKEIAAAGYSQVGLMGLVACQAAYEEGAEWLAQLKAYLEENRKFVKAYLEEHLPEIRLIEPEGTYLRGQGTSVAGQRRDVRTGRRGLRADQYRMPAGDGGESAEAAGSGDPRIKLIGSRIRTRINKTCRRQTVAPPHINSLSAAGFLTS